MEWLTRRWRHQQRKWREADERAPMIIIGWMEWLRQVA